MSRKLTITISPMAEINIDAVGFTGTDCTEATKGIERAVGADPDAVNRTYKPDYNAPTHTHTIHQTTRMG